MTFKELNLSAPLLRAVQEAGYETYFFSGETIHVVKNKD